MEMWSNLILNLAWMSQCLHVHSVGRLRAWGKLSVFGILHLSPRTFLPGPWYKRGGRNTLLHLALERKKPANR